MYNSSSLLNESSEDIYINFLKIKILLKYLGRHNNFLLI